MNKLIFLVAIILHVFSNAIVLYPAEKLIVEKTYTSRINGKEIITNIVTHKIKANPLNKSSVDARTNLEIHPNPANEFIKVDISNKLRHNSDDLAETASIFNLVGEIVMEKDVSNDSGNLLTLNVSSLPNGVYFIRIGDGIEKFIKK